MHLNSMNVTRLLIFGKVHGVGFRKFIQYNAKKLGLVGWVRNLPEGSVEAEVAGENESIKKLIAISRTGPFLAQVASVEVQKNEKEFPYTEFIIRRDVE